jgi:pyruvate ferredoxin oxidoreductase alpha subunit
MSMLNSLSILEQAYAAFAAQFGRSYSNLETYAMDGAEVVVIAMGSMTGTIRSVVKKMRQEGRPVGMVKIRTFRPFPDKELAKLLEGVKAVGVMDRNISFGSSGALFQETLRALYRGGENPLVLDFITGLGGRDVSVDTVHRVFDELYQSMESGDRKDNVIWVDSDRKILHAWGLEVNSDSRS